MTLLEPLSFEAVGDNRDVAGIARSQCAEAKDGEGEVVEGVPRVGLDIDYDGASVRIPVVMEPFRAYGVVLSLRRQHGVAACRHSCCGASTVGLP